MSTMTIRRIPAAVHNALKARARRHHRSAAAGALAILEEATQQETRLKIGDALAEMSRGMGLTNEDFDIFRQTRDKTAAEPMRFE